MTDAPRRVSFQRIAAIARGIGLAESNASGPRRTHRSDGVRVAKHGPFVVVTGLPEEILPLVSHLVATGEARCWRPRTRTELVGTITADDVAEGCVIVTG